MPPKSLLPASLDQPSVSQFFKRKTPPAAPGASASASSSSPAAKRVKLGAGPRQGRSPPPAAAGATSHGNEVIVLDSDDEYGSMDIAFSDDEIQVVPAATTSTAGRRAPTPSRPPRPAAPLSASKAHASNTPSTGSSSHRLPLLSAAAGGSSTAPRVKGAGAPPVAPVFQQAQQASLAARPAGSKSKRPSFNPKESSAAQALRALAYVDPDPSQADDQLGELSAVAGPSTQPPQLSADAARARDQRHERFKTKLLGRTFGRRRSLELEEAERMQMGSDEDRVEAGSDDEGGKAARGGDSEDPDASPPAKKGKIGELKSKFTAPPRKKALAIKKKAPPEVGPSGLTYTPLELQVKALKAANPGVLLIFEVGYKFRFFGEDSKTAAKVLNIVSFPDRNFFTASIPAHRLFIHVRNLIANGHKVGVIRQMETAALKKVGSNRSAPFKRKLTELYTASTWVDDLASADDGALASSLTAVPPSNALVSLVEIPVGKGKGRADDDAGEVRFGLVSVVPSTGDVTWDEFTDGAARTELETRITHIQPQELLLPVDKLSHASEKLLEQLLSPGSSSVRFERIPHDLVQDDALGLVTSFWKKKGSASVDKVRAVVDFPDAVVSSLAYAIRYLEDFKLSTSLSHTDTTFRRFSTQLHMLLNANTLANLEVYRNADDGGEKGSLLWLLASTTTKMGKRQLREWVGRPLVDKTKLEERIEAVTELSTDSGERTAKFTSLLKHLPDLPRGLVRIQSGRATPSELISVLKNFERIAVFWETAMTFNFSSPLLNAIIDSLSDLEEPLARYLDAVNEWKARDNDKPSLWKDKTKYPEIEDARDMIMFCDHELTEELDEIRKVMKRPKATYATVAGIENLIEIRTSDAKKVPPNWIKVSSTKNVVRFHNPQVLKIAQEKEQHRETLAAEADKAFNEFLAEVSESYDVFRTVANHVATLDCLMSLARMASMPGYSKPELTDEHQLVCEGAFHPMVAAVSDDTYVPNDVNMSATHGHTKVITGPNMGGKSSMVRTLALIVLMAQIGSYVPASSVKLGVHDAIYTRMGASDDILHGRSTFMVEISETSDVIRQATPTSLVILDELGRGTSTYDGQALAEAVLRYLVTHVRCNTLFITHYPLVATSLAKQHADVSNWHMGFSQRPRPDGSQEITFLYRLAAGLAKASFGIECARLAGVPADVLASAHAHSTELERKVELKTAAAKSRRMADVLETALGGEGDEADAAKTVRQARALLAVL